MRQTDELHTVCTLTFDCTESSVSSAFQTLALCKYWEYKPLSLMKVSTFGASHKAGDGSFSRAALLRRNGTGTSSGHLQCLYSSKRCACH